LFARMDLVRDPDWKMPRRTTATDDHAAHITPGVFFGAAVALPRGPQALPRADVLAAQRERLMAAMAELLAAGGYGQVKIGTLAARAKLSRTAFYECFHSKEACAFAAYVRQMHEEFRAADPTLAPPLPDEVYVGIVYVARSLACDALDEHDRPELTAIGKTLVPWLLTMFQPSASVSGPQPAPAAVRL